MKALHGIIAALGLVLIWQGVVWITELPHFMLPGPLLVLETAVAKHALLLKHAGVTAAEIILGLALGTALGGISALTLIAFRPARLWLMPVIVASQSLPVFALAPLLTLWLGYGLWSKIAMATLIIYFPVTSAFYDGMRRTEAGWIDLAKTMGANRWALLRHIRIPAALPSFASGFRVATAIAPIGAVVGEWVGSSAGLGYLMLHANGRLQTDLMFAAMLTLALIAVTLYFTADRLLRRLIRWQPETVPH